MSILFPITLPTDWSLAETHSALMATPSLKEWICCESSLTLKIKELGVSFSVEVLNQCVKELNSEQKEVLGSNDNQALVREVVLKQADIPLIYAQTIIPESTLVGANQRLAELGNQSLGQVLFQSQNSTRGKIEVAEVKQNSQLANFIQNELKQRVVSPCFIRRSLFNLEQRPLLVNECYLPILMNDLEAK